MAKPSPENDAGNPTQLHDTSVSATPLLAWQVSQNLQQLGTNLKVTPVNEYQPHVPV